MNARTLLALSLLTAAPSPLFAQTHPEPYAVVAPAPMAPRAAKAPVPAISSIPEAPAVPASPEAAQAPPVPRVAPTPAAAPSTLAPPSPPAPPRKRGQMLNVRIDVTLADSKGVPKVLTMTVADGESGMNRTTAVSVTGATATDYSFNADASPEVVGDRIRLRLTADAVVPVEAEKPSAMVPKLALRQSQTVILNDGETVEIARATDPASSRAFILSVKVTIQR